MTEILASLLMHSIIFSNLNVFIKILSSFVKDAMFVNMNYVTNDPPHLQRIFNHSIKNYWPVFNQPFSVLFFLHNDILITSLAHR